MLSQKAKMDTLASKENNSSNQSNRSSRTSSGVSSNSNASSSSNSSSADVKTPKKCTREQKLSRSFLHCIGKHLGRHFLHHHPHHHRHHSDAMYNSQDDIRSSSTDSFSLSFERGSHGDCHLTGSTIELAEGERSHGIRPASSSTTGSSFSPARCAFDVSELDLYDDDDDEEDDKQTHEEAVALNRIYRRTMRALSNSSGSANSDSQSSRSETCSNSSDEDEENAAPQQQHQQTSKQQQQQQQQQQRNKTSNCKRLQLSRISISSSVNRMLHHFSSTNSMRSLSCSSTPLRCAKEPKQKKANSAAALTAKTSGNSSSSSSSSGASNKKKKEKKQQSILRPPVHYVYMKGMSGLYSRVPRYSVCCPYAMQQIA